MSILAELTRPYWLPGIHAVAGRQPNGLAAWIAEEEFQIYVPLTRDTATVSFVDASPIVNAYAGDCGRMAAAAIESAVDVEPSTRLPRSTAWFIIRAYYSAFFAAHAVLRMFGVSLTQLEGAHAAAITDIADIFGMANGAVLAGGFYVCKCDAHAKTLSVVKALTADRSHGAVWRALHDVLGDIADSILASSTPAAPAQQVAAKLTEVRTALSYDARVSKGSWLSEVRNRTNYRHDYGTWYPYVDRMQYYDRLYDLFAQWRDDPMKISLWSQPGRDLQRFAEASAFIVALCRVMSEDMAKRCPKGASFHRTSSLAIRELA